TLFPSTPFFRSPPMPRASGVCRRRRTADLQRTLPRVQGRSIPSGSLIPRFRIRERGSEESQAVPRDLTKGCHTRDSSSETLRPRILKEPYQVVRCHQQTHICCERRSACFNCQAYLAGRPQPSKRAVSGLSEPGRQAASSYVETRQLATALIARDSIAINDTRPVQANGIDRA